jgi:hypothetical protein
MIYATPHSYTALKKRRDYEIEGFTADIVNLRTQLRTLEKSLLKYGSLEDKELILLNLGISWYTFTFSLILFTFVARLTGERAGKISQQLQHLKVMNSELFVNAVFIMIASRLKYTRLKKQFKNWISRDKIKQIIFRIGLQPISWFL